MPRPSKGLSEKIVQEFGVVFSVRDRSLLYNTYMIMQAYI